MRLQGVRTAFFKTQRYAALLAVPFQLVERTRGRVHFARRY